MVNKKDWRSIAKVLIGGSLIAVIFSAIGYMGTDIWLASTQWLLIAAVLAALGVYARLNT